MPKKFNRHLDNKLNFTPASTHETSCSDCRRLFECTCANPTKHKERRDRGWDDRCSNCEMTAQKNWSGWLTSLPETRTFEPLPGRRDG